MRVLSAGVAWKLIQYRQFSCKNGIPMFILVRKYFVLAGAVVIIIFYILTG
jgi:hypothetical protein